MSTRRYVLAVVAASVATSLTAATFAAAAEPAGSAAAALTQGKPSLQLRPRYEYVEQTGFADPAEALTMRTQLGYTSGAWRGISGMLQAEDVSTIGVERFNSTTNGKTQFPVVADPSSTEINQAYVRYAGMPWLDAKYGRQVIAYDNHRFIGDVGWRQNQQTFDALALALKPLTALTVNYAHVTNVNRIFGERHATLSDFRMDSDLVNASWKTGIGTAVAYAYMLEFIGAPAASNQTRGLRLDGALPVGAAKLLYTAERAQQGDYADAPATVDADYTLGALGLDIAGVQIKANYELLSGNGVYALQTPLATLHAFNGWADRFLITPADGLEDMFLSAGAALAGFNVVAQYHRYQSDHLAYRYGDEWGVSIARKLGGHITALVKYADYRGAEGATLSARNPALAQDMQKAWLQLDFQY